MINFFKEYRIRRILRRLSRQRVAIVLNPGNTWVIEKSLGDDENTDLALKTCYLRGWVEPIENAIPQGKLTKDAKLPEGDLFNKIGPMYRVTEAGWSVINRSHQWALVTVFLTLIAVIVSINDSSKLLFNIFNIFMKCYN